MAISHPSDSQSLVQASWADFLSRYARGEFPSDSTPPLPPLPSPPPEHVRPSSEPLDHLFEAPTYDTIDITPSIAERVGEFYCKHAFLPPPRAPSEAVRERVILEYDLYSQEQIDNIQSATDLVQAYFGGLCTFTLFRDNVQVLMAVSGDSAVIEAVGLHPGKRLLPETSLCGHQVLFRRRSMYIPDLASDWRTAGNPYADALKGVKSYLGAAVFLPVDPVQCPASISNASPWPAKEDTGREVSGVGVGVINLMHLDKYLPPPTPSQERVLHHVTRMLETQLRATWEGHARTKEAKARRTVCEYIDHRLVPRSGTSSGPDGAASINVDMTGRQRESKGVVQEVQAMPSAAGISTETRTTAGARLPEAQPRPALLAGGDGSPSSSGSQSRPSSLGAPQRVLTPLPDGGIESDPIFSAAQDVCDRIKYVLNEAEAVGVVDLRAVQRVRNSSGPAHPHPYAVHDDPIFPLQIHGWSCSTGQPPPDLSDPSAISAILAFLVMHRSSAEELFDAVSKPSGLEHFLPASTRSQLVVPFSIADEPTFLIIVTSSKQFWTFRGTEANLVRSMGVVLRAQVVQRRLVEADAAKTVFLSSVSHELRTPLHGLMTGLQLVAESLRHGEPEHALRLLPMVESSGQTLQQILDDILDFGKMMHTRSSAGDNATHGSEGPGSGSTSPSSDEGGLTNGCVARPSSSPANSESRRRSHEADLARDVMDAARTCWPRILTRGNIDQDARQGLRETIERGSSIGEIVGSRLDAEAQGDVELVVEWEERDWRCMIDQVAFQRILFNGLTNALKFTKSGTVRVSLQTLPAAGILGSRTPVLLTMTDTGPGIPPALLSRLFRPFTKGDTFVPGTGLGLFIMRELVEGMDGSVNLTSEEGRGTELRVELPVEFLQEVGAGQGSESRAMRRVTISDEFSLTQRPDPPSVGSTRPPSRRTSPKASNVKPAPAAAPPAAEIRPFRVLIVDDNDISRALLVALIQRLKDPSIVVKQARDGVDGLDVYQSFLPQLVATDVSMPEMDGIAMSTAIREFERAQNIAQPAQIYAITGLGSSDPRMRADALRGGAELDGWLVKGKENLASMRQIVLDAKRRHDAGSIEDVQGGLAGLAMDATSTVAASTVATSIAATPTAVR